MSSLENLKNTIETFPRYHQIEILSILKQYNIDITENNNGTFINLTKLDEKIINVLDNYVNYVEEQKNHLDVVEKEKERIEKTYFNKEGKDNKDSVTESL
tara:strand:- start:1214 stop:1513 length:300 start_codon:yes stop_codon:yes gene_type:complete